MGIVGNKRAHRQGGKMDKQRRKKKVVKVPTALKQQARGQALAEARALHQSIVKRTMAAGYNYEKIKKDVNKALKDVRSDSTCSR